MHQPSIEFEVMTAPRPGAIAIVQLTCDEPDRLCATLSRLTSTSEADGLDAHPSAAVERWPVGRLRLASIAGVDEGLVGRVSETIAQVMPHGGAGVLAAVSRRLTALGGRRSPQLEPLAAFPEAADLLEAEMLAALADAASPAAIDLLLPQPAMWRDALKRSLLDDPATRERIARYSRARHWLLKPATIVVVGRPNVGKSTLSNRLLGRAASVTADLPGSTRDWVGAMAQLSTSAGRTIVVRWIDTPGLHASADAVEQRAIALAAEVVREAQVVIAMRDPFTDWPEPVAERPPDLWVCNKADLASPNERPAAVHGDQSVIDALADEHGRCADQPLAISAKTGAGLALLESRVLEALGLNDLSSDALWAYSPRLVQLVQG